MIEASNVPKTEKYSELVMDLEDSGFRVKLMPVEVGVWLGSRTCSSLK